MNLLISQSNKFGSNEKRQNLATCPTSVGSRVNGQKKLIIFYSIIET